MSDGTLARPSPPQAPSEELMFRGQAGVLRMIAEGDDLDAVLHQLTTAIEDASDGMRASVLLLDGEHLVRGAAPSLPEAYNAEIDGLVIGPEVGSCGAAAHRGQLVVVEDVLVDPRWEAFRDLARIHGLRACWSAPIVASTGAVLGTFALYYDEPRSPTDPELELVRTAARLAAIALERDRSERELEASRSRFLALFLSSPMGMTLLDGEHVVLEANDALARLLGHPAPALVDVPLESLIDTDDPAPLSAAIDRVLTGGQPATLDLTLRPDGPQAVHAHLTVAGVPANGDTRPRCVAVFQDVTERRQLEELRTRQRELELAAEHSQALAGLAGAAVVINSQRSIEEMLSSITQQACVIIGAHLGSTSLTMPGTGEEEGWPQLGISVQLSDKYAEWRAYEAPSRGAPSYGLVCRNNDVVRMTDEELKAHPLWRNFGQEEGRHPPMRGWLAAPLVASDGSNLGMLQLSDRFDGEFTEADESIVIQLAQMASVAVEKAQLHQQTRQHVDQLRALTRASTVINSPMSLEQMLDSITDETASALGVHQVVVSLTQGDDWSQAITSVHLSDKYAAWREFDAAPDGRGIYALVCRGNRPMRLTQAELEAHPAWRGYGEHADTHPPMRGWLAAPLVTRDGDNLGLIQVSDKLDDTDFAESDEALLVQIAQMASVAIEKAQLYELAAEQRQTRLREELLSGLSHDMQTPLATIAGLVEVLAEDLPLDAPDHREAFQVLTRQTDHLYVLIQQFLDHLRLQADRELNLATRPVDPLVPIRRVVELFEYQREVRPPEDPHGAPAVLADPARLQQVLANLVANAVKFSSAPVEIELEVHDDRVTIHVDDRGVGLPDPDDPDVVFERFFRGPETAGTPGTGLGLYITHEVVQAMGGEIHAAPRPDGGSRFSVTLQRAERV